MEQINHEIFEALDILIQKALDKFNVCGIYTGVVKEVIDSKDYVIKYNEITKKIRTKNNLNLNVGEKVTILSLTNTTEYRLLEDVKIEVDGIDLANYVSDKNYVHTDNNYTDDDKAKVNSLETTINNTLTALSMTDEEIISIYNSVFK